MKICLVHEWLVTYAGSERVLSEISKTFPDADIFCVVDFLSESDRENITQGRPTKQTFIQKLPFAKKHYRNYLALMPTAIEQLDLSNYDVIISSSHAVAKGILTGPDQLHISYIHSPIRYAWDLQHQYLRESNLTKGLKSWIARAILHYIRIWDSRTSNGVDHFVANSQFIARRINKAYGRAADVIYPPVDVESFRYSEAKEEFYLSASRLVPYKRMDLIVRAFSKMPEKQLIVIGDGPDLEKIRKQATPNIKILGHQPFESLLSHMQRAKAFVFAAEEDFGITPLEAQACGTPVIAFGKGGSLETVHQSEDRSRSTGLWFSEQSEDSIIDAVKRFESLQNPILSKTCREHAEKFSSNQFRSLISSYVNSRWEHFSTSQRNRSIYSD